MAKRKTEKELEVALAQKAKELEELQRQKEAAVIKRRVAMAKILEDELGLRTVKDVESMVQEIKREMVASAPSSQSFPSEQRF